MRLQPNRGSARSLELPPIKLAMILAGVDVTKLKRVPYERTSTGNRENIAV